MPTSRWYELWFGYVVDIEGRIILILQTVACHEEIDQKNIDQSLDYMMMILVVQTCTKMELKYMKDLQVYKNRYFSFTLSVLM